MAAPRYLKQLAGAIVEMVAATVGGAGDAEKIPSLDVNGRLTAAMMPVGVGPEVQIMPASEALSAGNLVNVYDDSGTIKCRKADAATAKPAHGFVLAAVESAANATVLFEGTNDELSGMSGGPTMYLSDATPGGVTATPPSTATYIVQEVGCRLSATELAFNPKLPITLA